MGAAPRRQSPAERVLTLLYVRKIASCLGTRRVNAAAIVLRENTAVLAGRQCPRPGRFGVGSREAMNYHLFVLTQESGDACHFRGPHAHDGVAAATGARGTVDAALHFRGDRLKRFETLVVRRQVAPELRVLSALGHSPLRDLRQVGDHALSIAL